MVTKTWKLFLLLLQNFNFFYNGITNIASNKNYLIRNTILNRMRKRDAIHIAVSFSQLQHLSLKSWCFQNLPILNVNTQLPHCITLRRTSPGKYSVLRTVAESALTRQGHSEVADQPWSGETRRTSFENVELKEKPLLYLVRKTLLVFDLLRGWQFFLRLLIVTKVFFFCVRYLWVNFITFYGTADFLYSFQVSYVDRYKIGCVPLI